MYRPTFFVAAVMRRDADSIQISAGAQFIIELDRNLALLVTTQYGNPF